MANTKDIINELDPDMIQCYKCKKWKKKEEFSVKRELEKRVAAISFTEKYLGPRMEPMCNVCYNRTIR